MASLSDISNALKIDYPWSQMARDWYKDHPLSTWFPRRKDFYGKQQNFSVSYGPGGGISHTFSDAQGQEDTPNKYAEFTIARVKSYGLLYLDGEAIEASKDNGASYVNTQKDHIEAVLNRLKVQEGYETIGFSGAVTGTGTSTRASGAIAQVASTWSADNTISLTNADHITRFEPGMRLASCASASEVGTLRTGTPGYLTVDTVDAVAGTFEATDYTDIDSFAASDYLFPVGNHNVAMTGLKAWLPTTAEIASYPALWGVTRTDHRHRLAGYYEDVSSYGHAEAVKQFLVNMARLRIYPDVFWVSVQQYMNIEQDLDAKARREPVKVGEWGYDSLVVHNAGRKCRIMADPNIDDADGFALTRDTWCRHTLKAMPRFLTYGAGKEIMKPTDDGIELRLGWRGNLTCRKPGANGRALLPT